MAAARDRRPGAVCVNDVPRQRDGGDRKHARAEGCSPSSEEHARDVAFLASRDQVGDWMASRCRASHQTGGQGCDRRRRRGARGGSQRDARAVYETANRPRAEAEGRGHALVAVPFDGRAQQGLALYRGQRGHRRQCLAERGQLFASTVRGICGRGPGAEIIVNVAAAAQDVNGGVVHDAMEPCSGHVHLGAPLQRRPGLQQPLLQGVLRTDIGQ